MLSKDPTQRITLSDIKTHPWVTCHGAITLPSEKENCHLVIVTDEDVRSCVKLIPKLNTLVRNADGLWSLLISGLKQTG